SLVVIRISRQAQAERGASAQLRWSYRGGVKDRDAPPQQPRPMSEPLDGIESVSVLVEESRRRMFAFIRGAGHPVTRDEAAASVGISRKLAAFHLDKLVDAGLLRARYGAPGAQRRVGRQPKVYEPTDAQISVTIPERR